MTAVDRRWGLAACASVLLLGLIYGRPAPSAQPAAGSAATGGTPQPGPVAGLVVHRLDMGSIKPGAPGTVRMGMVAPPSPRADIVFVHGHADRLDNHAALMSAWVRAGFRVIAFDLPSHGSTHVQAIDAWSFDDLYKLVRLVERTTVARTDRPLFLAGWSFGGLVVTRLAQTPKALAGFTRPVRGLVLLAPAVDVFPFAGGDGIARASTLTHPPHAAVAGPPRPAAPLLNPVFAVRLLAAAAAGRHTDLPKGLPALVLAADEREDLYVKERSVVRWARQNPGAQVYQCPQARHSLDNEPYPIGPAVAARATAFLNALTGGATQPDPTLDETCSRR